MRRIDTDYFSMLFLIGFHHRKPRIRHCGRAFATGIFAAAATFLPMINHSHTWHIKVKTTSPKIHLNRVFIKTSL